MKKNIVLVIGAGASYDFNNKMGLGTHLIEEIRKRVFEKDEAYLSKVLTNSGINPSKLKCFQDLLNSFIKSEKENNRIPTIDAFINSVKDNQQLVDIGKIMIQFHVLGYEQECEKDATFETGSTWLHKLSNLIFEHDILETDTSRVNLNIVTFNYDRLLEEYLFRKFGQKAELFCNENVSHVYGKLSHLPWQHKILKDYADKGQVMPFIHFAHPNYDETRISERKLSINLIYENERANTDKAKYQICKADEILFMGFGFDKTNLTAIGITQMKESTKSMKRWIALFHNTQNNSCEVNKSNFNEKLEIVKDCTCQDFIVNNLKNLLNS